jgi:hypothetical protein
VAVPCAAADYSDVQDATSALNDGSVDAVVDDSPVLRYYARTSGRNRTQVVGPLHQPQGYGMVFQLGSPLVGPVDEQFLAEREDGTSAALQERYSAERRPGSLRPTCSDRLVQTLLDRPLVPATGSPTARSRSPTVWSASSGWRNDTSGWTV